MCQDPGVDKTKPKRNLFDNANNLLTNFLSSGNLKNMPVAEGNEVIGSGGSKQEKKPSQIFSGSVVHFMNLLFLDLNWATPWRNRIRQYSGKLSLVISPMVHK